jgi:hypothetical protein
MEALSPIQVYALSRSYTDETVIGGGAIKGKNCTIDSITDISDGKRVIFKWTLDDGTEKTGTMDVMNGEAGKAGATGADGRGIKSSYVNSSDHFIIVYDDDQEEDCGLITVVPAESLGDLTDVSISNPISGQVLKRNDSGWVNSGLEKSDVGLGNVDNTSDANKPVSTATQNALNLKQDALTAGDGIDISVDKVISAKHRYSTQEQIVGEWIDGKPLYQRTFSGSVTAVDTDTTISIGSNIDFAMIVNATMKQSDVAVHDLYLANNAMDTYFKVWVNLNGNESTPNKINMRTSQSNWLNQTVYVTLQYTKTTD